MYLIRSTEIRRTCPYQAGDEAFGKLVLHSTHECDSLGQMIEMLLLLDKMAEARGWVLIDRKQGDALYQIPGQYASSYSYYVSGPHADYVSPTDR